MVKRAGTASIVGLSFLLAFAPCLFAVGGILGGTCPDIYYTSSKNVNGATVSWTSSFGGFDYSKGGDYAATVTWTVTGGTASFVGFNGKHKTWTPKGVNGTWLTGSQSGGSLELTVSMPTMHRSVEPTWQGYIGNAHFKLELIVNGVRVKLGVNVHLEDPDPGSSLRCPTGFDPPPSRM